MFVGIGALPTVIPDSIDSLAKGDPAQVAAVRAGGADPSRAGTDGPGLFYGAFCSEWVPYEPQSEILTEGKKLFPTLPDSVLRQAPQLAFLNEDCAVWKVPKAPADQRSTKPSEIPTLLVSNTFDAQTAPFLGEHAAKSLPNSMVVNIPGVGHVVVPKSQCAQQVFHSFLASPSSPDTSRVKNAQAGAVHYPLGGEKTNLQRGLRVAAHSIAVIALCSSAACGDDSSSKTAASPTTAELAALMPRNT